jgi:hypothetical protein
MKSLLWISACLLALVGAAGAQHTAEDGTQRTAPWTKETLALASRLPVQDGGRVKPLSTYRGLHAAAAERQEVARNALGEVIDATTWLLDTLFFPLGAAEYKCFHVTNDEVIAAMGLRLDGKKKSDRYSMMELRPGIDRLYSWPTSTTGSRMPSARRSRTRS